MSATRLHTVPADRGPAANRSDEEWAPGAASSPPVTG